MTGRAQRQIAPLVVAVVLLSLTGCFADAAPQPTGTPTPTSGAAAPTSTPTSTPPAAASLIDPRIPIECADLMDPQLLSTAIGVPVAQLELRADEPLYSVEGAARGQSGWSTCNWTQAGTPTAGGMYIDILPEAADAFHTYSRAENARARQYALESGQTVPTTERFGPDSHFECSLSIGDSYASRTCGGALEVVGYWVAFRFSASLSDRTDSDAGDDLAISVGNAIRLALEAGGLPRARYVIPVDAAAPWESCAALDAGGTFRRVTASSTLLLRDLTGLPPDMFSAAVAQSPFVECYWVQSAYPVVDCNAENYFCQCDECYYYDYEEVRANLIPDEIDSIDVSILPGGEWAWNELSFEAPPMDAESLARLGVPDGMLSCDLWGGWCDIQVLIDHSIVSASFYYPDATPGTDDAKERALGVMHYLLRQLGG